MSQRGSYGEDDGRRADGGGDIDLRALGRGLWRRKRWIVGPAIVAATLAFVFCQASTPYFRSSALVLIENREGAAPRAGAERDAQLPDEQAVVSQVQLIQSRDLVRTVVKQLDLSHDHEFTSQSTVQSLLSAIGLGGSQADLPFNEKVVDKVAERLNVYPVTGSRVVGVEFVSSNPDTAAKVVNGFVDAFLDLQRDAKRQSNRQASQYLSDELANMRGRVAEAEERVETFRAKAGLLVGTNNTTVAAQELGDTTIQLSAARTQQTEAQAKADMMRSVMKQGRPSETLDIANSDLVRSLAQQRSQLAAQIASEGRTLLPQHPRMRELSAQIEGLEDQIRREAEKLARAFENDAKTAGVRVAALNAQLDKLKTTASSANTSDVQLRAMEREARSQRDLLEQMLTRYREATARDNPDALLADARVISRGSAATEPYFPKKGPTILLTAIAVFALSLFGAAAAEVFGGARVEDGRAAPPPAVGAVPVFVRARDPLRVNQMKPARPVRSVQGGGPTASAGPEEPDDGAPQTDMEAEHDVLKAEPAHETAVTAVAMECADAALATDLAKQLAGIPTDGVGLKILVVGTKPSLAISVVAAELASAISASGRRVVAVDAGASPEAAGPGLSDLLAGTASFSQAIHRDPGSRVHLVPGGAQPFERLDYSAQERLGVVVEALALTYDFVMLMSPAGVAGAEPFATLCSAAVLVSDAGASDAATVEAHERLKRLGVDDLVVLLVGDGDAGPDGRSMAA